jgi:phosphatidylserine/phosphatidylglycerophosphate/cardiolipin synthase-like enzyme
MIPSAIGALVDALLDLPPFLRERLASALDSGLLDGAPSETALRSVLGCTEPVPGLSQGLAELQRLGVTGRAAAAWMWSISRAESRSPRPDLAWSGPSVQGAGARDTRRVYEELLGSAQRSLWVSTYAFFDGPKAFEVLARRMDATPQLEVTLLLNIQRIRGDTTAADFLVRRFADRFWGQEWPGASRPRVYYDARALEPDAPGGVLHAKAVVADEEAVFITSANLTEAALERNIELGLVLRDRALALSIVAHFRGLIEGRLLSALPRE